MNNLVWLDPGFAIAQDKVIAIKLEAYIDTPDITKWYVYYNTTSGVEKKEFGPGFKDIYKAKEWLKTQDIG